MRYDCDVAVVGAGPAGSRTARNLARSGLRVKLLEEHRKIGVPSHCSGLISLRTLREAEIGEDAIIHRINGAFIHGPDGSQVGLDAGSTSAVAIDRVKWDETLCEQAQRDGADLLTARVLNVERTNGGVTLQTLTPNGRRTVTARMVVGADGGHSRVGRSLGLARPGERVYCLGIEARMSVPREDFVHVFVGRDLAPGWFGWIIPTGDGAVRVGIGCRVGNSHKPIDCYRSLASQFDGLFHDIEPIHYYGGTIPLQFAERSYADNVVLVGDAAGQVKPFSGGGIYTGLVGARHAATAVRRAFDKNDLSTKTLAPYEREWKREIGRELQRSRRLRHAGLSLSDAETDLVVNTLRNEGIQQIAARHGDIDYPSRVLTRVARSFPALTTLARISLRHPSATLNLLRAHLPWA
ncbi:MAG: NAD(P)/FAD-dependent oxidoreductase [Chloroflexi bacterium]|nr:NAD(P)/FAD-dependent oxidoreductase [Chloroflexota bacterium]